MARRKGITANKWQIWAYSAIGTGMYFLVETSKDAQRIWDRYKAMRKDYQMVEIRTPLNDTFASWDKSRSPTDSDREEMLWRYDAKIVMGVLT